MVSFSGTAQLGTMVRSSSSTSSMEEYRGGGRMKSYRRTDPIAVVEDCERNEFGYFDCPCIKRTADGGKCKDRFLSVNSLYAHYFTTHYQLPGRHYCGACCIRFKSHREREEHNYTVHFAKPQADSTQSPCHSHSHSHNHNNSHTHTHDDDGSHHTYTGMNTNSNSTYCYDKCSADAYTGMSGISSISSSTYSYPENKSASTASPYDCTGTIDYMKTSPSSHGKAWDGKKACNDNDSKNGGGTYAHNYGYSYSSDYSKHGPVHSYQVNTADYVNSHVMKNNYNSYVDLKHSVHSGIDADNVQNVAFGGMTKNSNYKPSQHHLCHINHHVSHINHG